MNPITYRTFEDDGYRDAAEGRPPNPPDAYNGSRVYADEYMRGYRLRQQEAQSQYYA